MKRSFMGLAILLCLLAMLTISPAASAQTVEEKADGIVILRYGIIDMISTGVSISNNIATCRGSVVTTVPCSIEMVLELQQITDNGWETIKEWTDSRNNTMSFTMKKTRTVGNGSFRTVVSVTVTTADGDSEPAEVISISETN